MTRPLTEEDKRRGFLAVTRGMAGASDRWQQRAAKGMTDAELAAALEYELGIEGGASGWPEKGIPANHHKGAGLQIWLSWDFPRCHQQRPTFKGSETVAMAREVYGIPNPDNKQTDIFAGAR